MMKLTRKLLRKMILEEKQLLSENSPEANARYQQGTYANVSGMDKVQSTISELLQQVDRDALEDMGDEDDADMAAIGAVTLTVAETFQALGMVAQYDALIRTLR